MTTVMLRGQSEIKYGVGPSTVWKHQEGRCFYCEKPLNPLGGANCTRDHLFPSSAGFTLRGNCVISCGKCNRKKGNKLPTIKHLQRAYDLIYKHHAPDQFVVHFRNGKPVVRFVENAQPVEYVKDHYHARKRRHDRARAKLKKHLTIDQQNDSLVDQPRGLNEDSQLQPS